MLNPVEKVVTVVEVGRVPGINPAYKLALATKLAELDCIPFTVRERTLAAPVTTSVPVLEVFDNVVTPATPNVPVLEELTNVAEPPINRFPVLDCVPVTRRALEAFVEPPAPSFKVVIVESCAVSEYASSLVTVL